MCVHQKGDALPPSLPQSEVERVAKGYEYDHVYDWTVILLHEIFNITCEEHVV